MYINVFRNLFTRRTHVCYEFRRNFLKSSSFVLWKEKNSEFQKACVDNDSSTKRIGMMAKLVKTSPIKMQPYMKLVRLDAPIGFWLVFWPCGWSLSIAVTPGALPDAYLLGLFGTGAVLMRGAACTINDIIDCDLDKKVARTSNRPLANGSITVQQSVMFLAVQLCMALLVLVQMNWFSIVLGAGSMALVILYPIMKRVTHWAQIVLGITSNWGVLLASTSVHGYLDYFVCLPLYLATICWTVIYDTIYAHQDIEEDLTLGLKSTAINFGQDTKYWLAGFAVIMNSGLLASGLVAQQTWPYYTSVTLAAAHIAWQIYDVKLDVHVDCAKKFRSNFYIGAIVFSGIVLGNLIKE